MANIVFSWEIGFGTGHYAPYINLIKILESQGHNVYFILRHLTYATHVFKDTNVKFFQAPIRHGNINRPTGIVPDCYSRVLALNGYNKPEELSALILAWKNLFELIKPDLIISDYAPTALLASRGFPIPKIMIGSGFLIPPKVQPIPGFLQLQGQPQDQNDLLAHEQEMLSSINQALHHNHLPPFEQFNDISNADLHLLTTFPELDHFPREASNTIEYIGVFRSRAGAQPDWPNFPGPKIFAYLKPFDALPNLLGYIRQLGYPTLIYGDGISTEIKTKFQTDRLKFSEKPLDMKAIGQTADIGIFNGNHGTAAELLLQGLPLLTLPLHAEQHILSKKVEAMGCGLCPEKNNIKMIIHHLESVINKPQFRERSRDFAKKYQEYNDELILEKLSKAILSYIE